MNNIVQGISRLVKNKYINKMKIKEKALNHFIPGLYIKGKFLYLFLSFLEDYFLFVCLFV